MSIPKYDELMLPLLLFLGDEREHSLREAVETLASQFKLSEEERKELLPSGIQAKFNNRVGWARTYLKKAGLIEAPVRGKCRITQRGLEVLRNKPEYIDAKLLKQFPEFVEFQTVSRSGDKEVDIDETTQTPEETLENSYLKLRKELAAQLLEIIKACDPGFFERIVVDLLLAMGYGGSRQDAGQVTGKSGDEGIDGVINEDKLGLDVIYIQAKRWKKNVQQSQLREFAGSLEGRKASKGIIITTSDFAAGAKDYVDKIGKKIVLINGEKLAELMIDHHVGVTEIANYTLKKIDFDYFNEE